MPIEFSKPGPAIRVATVEAFEQTIGHPLPADYRTFLIESNGGVPVQDHIPSNADVGIDAFFSLDSNDPDYGMAPHLAVYADRYPATMLPIASSVGSNLILIDVAGDDIGSVWFWDHEAEADEGEPPRTDNITKLADDFDSFLDQLTKDVDPEFEALYRRALETATGWEDPDFKPRFD